MKHKIMEGMRKCLQGKLNGGTRGRKIDMGGVRPGEVEDGRNEGMKEEDKSTEETASGNRQMEEKM